MVFGNVKHLEEFSFLDSSVRECLDYFNSHDLASYEKEAMRLMESGYS